MANLRSRHYSALAIQRSTLHSLIGAHASTDLTNPQDFVSRMSAVRKQQLSALKLLVVDDISWMSKSFFCFVSSVLAIVKENTSVPFGGIQIVVCGDFLQVSFATSLLTIGCSSADLADSHLIVPSCWLFDQRRRMMTPSLNRKCGGTCPSLCFVCSAPYATRRICPLATGC